MALSPAAKEQAIRDLGAERAVATGMPTTRKWISTCGHRKSIAVGSMEYEDAEQNGWSYCNRNGCKDTLAGQWADAPRKGDIVNGKPAAKATKTKTTPQPVMAAKKSTASRARKAADTLPNKVRQHREAADLSPKDLAQRLGKDWSASTVRRIERGARKATPEQVAQLADTLQVPVAELGFTTATVDESAAALPRVDATDRKAGKAKPAAKVVAVGKRTGKAIATTQDVKDEVGAILGA